MVIESKIDHLHEFVSNVYSDLDIIAITETSHKSDNFQLFIGRRGA